MVPQHLTQSRCRWHCLYWHEPPTISLPEDKVYILPRPCQYPSNKWAVAVNAIRASKDETSPRGTGGKVSPGKSGEDTGQNVSWGPFVWHVDEEGKLWARGKKGEDGQAVEGLGPSLALPPSAASLSL